MNKLLDTRIVDAEQVYKMAAAEGRYKKPYHENRNTHNWRMLAIRARLEIAYTQ